MSGRDASDKNVGTRRTPERSLQASECPVQSAEPGPFYAFLELDGWFSDAAFCQETNQPCSAHLALPGRD